MQSIEYKGDLSTATTTSDLDCDHYHRQDQGGAVICPDLKGPYSGNCQDFLYDENANEEGQDWQWI